MNEAIGMDNTGDPVMDLPEQSLGADLIWWRNSPSVHTAVTLWGGITDLSGLGSPSSAQAEVLCRLYDVSGSLSSSWSQTMQAGVPLIVDSREHPHAPEE